MVRQEVYRKQGYAVQADEEQLRVQLENLQAELNAPMQFKVKNTCKSVCKENVLEISFVMT